jgi:hypothetical protein
MRRLALILAGLVSAGAAAEPWTFGEPLTVAAQQGEPHFHHLDGSARRHVAAGADAVAVAWEDDRDGSPQVYLAERRLDAGDFAAHRRVSSGAEAYEPALAALGDGRWLVAWEQDGGVWARIVDADGMGEALRLAADGARQVTLAVAADGAIAALWARDRSGGQLLEALELRADGATLATLDEAVAVSPVDDHPYQGHPAAAWTGDGRLVVAWEDRRAGHTRIFASWRDGRAGFAPARQLNEHNAPPGQDSGLGSGVMRVGLAADAVSGLVRAIWLDKRNAASGYAVWGAASGDRGETFGTNRIVQDEHGATVAQWHAGLAAAGGRFVAAWDDAREVWSDPDESGDVILSWHDGEDWSADLVVPGASGSGYQGAPAVTLDPHGGLHLVWLERDDLTAPTRLRYLHGRP